MGARPLARKINELIKVPLSKKILFEHTPAHSIVTVDCKDKALVFDTHSVYDSATQPMIDSNGYIVLDSVKS
jgi:hypothetical protein